MSWLTRGVTLWCRPLTLADKVSAFDPLPIRDPSRGATALVERLEFVRGASRVALKVALGHQIAAAKIAWGEAAFLLELAGEIGCVNFGQSVRALLSNRTVLTEQEKSEFGAVLVSASGLQCESAEELMLIGTLLVERHALPWGAAIQLVSHIVARDPTQLDACAHQLAPFLGEVNAKADEFLVRQLLDRASEAWVSQQVAIFPKSATWTKIGSALRKRAVRENIIRPVGFGAVWKKFSDFVDHVTTNGISRELGLDAEDILGQEQ